MTTPERVLVDAFAVELANSLHLIRELLAKTSPLDRPEAEAWVRIELFTMTAANYFDQAEPALMGHIHDNVAFNIAATLPRSNPRNLT